MTCPVTHDGIWACFHMKNCHFKIKIILKAEDADMKPKRKYLRISFFFFYECSSVCEKELNMLKYVS